MTNNKYTLDKSIFNHPQHKMAVSNVWPPQCSSVDQTYSRLNYVSSSSRTSSQAGQHGVWKRGTNNFSNTVNASLPDVAKIYVNANHRKLLKSNNNSQFSIKVEQKKANVYLNPNTIHVNSTRLIAPTTSIGASDSFYHSVNEQYHPKHSIYINPGYNCNQNDQIRSEPILLNTTSIGQSSNAGSKVTLTNKPKRPCDIQREHPSSNIHFNKNFIEKSTVLGTLNNLHSQNNLPNQSSFKDSCGTYSKPRTQTVCASNKSEELKFSGNSSSLIAKSYKNLEDIVILKESKVLSDLPVNKSTVNSVGGYKSLINNTIKVEPSQIALEKQQSTVSNKKAKLVHLSQTKLVRQTSASSRNITKTRNYKPKLNQTLGCNTKQTKNKVWLANGSQTCNNKIVKRLEVRKAPSTGVGRNVPNSRYKYNVKNKVVCAPVGKTNCISGQLTSERKTQMKMLNKNQSSLNMAYVRDKCDVSRRKILRKVSSDSGMFLLSPTKLVRKGTSVVTSSKKRNNKLVWRRDQMKSSNSKSGSSSIQLVKPITTNKLLPVLRTANSVKSKYKFVRPSNTQLNWRSARYTATASIYRQRNAYYLKYRNSRRVMPRKRKESVVIGGINYHTTRTKLRRKYSDEGKLSRTRIFKNKGDSYCVKNNGKSLKRITPVVTSFQLKKLRSMLNNSYRNKTLQNAHFARNILAQAKQRSIALLTKKLRKNNEPCFIFTQTGRCSRKEKGQCIKVHDKKHVAICRKFLKGNCENSKCMLSHEVGPAKMPTCKHYLAGVCVRHDCPYPHVKLNSSAPVCLLFLQGYCPDAEKCKKRHVRVCPEFERNGTCLKGKLCQYPHPKRKPSGKSKVVTGTESAVNNLDKCSVHLGDEVSKSENTNSASNRYYEVIDSNGESKSIDDKESRKRHSESPKEDSVDEDQSDTGWLRKRPKLGYLPAFIPFNNEDAC